MATSLLNAVFDSVSLDYNVLNLDTLQSISVAPDYNQLISALDKVLSSQSCGALTCSNIRDLVSTSAAKKGGAKAAKTPKTPAAAKEDAWVTLETSQVGKTFLGDEKVLTAAAIGYKNYHQYLFRKVMIATETGMLYPAIIRGLASVSGENIKHITSDTGAFNTVWFDFPCSKENSAVAVEIKKGTSYIKERITALVFKSIPPSVLKASGIATFSSKFLMGLPRQGMRAAVYKELLNKYYDLVEMYDAWQTSEKVPMSATGHSDGAKYVQNPNDFEAFLSLVAEDTNPEIAAQGAKSLKENAELLVPPVIAVVPTTGAGHSPSGSASPSGSMFRDKVHPETPLMKSVFAETDEKEIASSADGNTKTSVLFLGSAVTKMDAITDSAFKHGFMPLINLGDVENQLVFDNKKGDKKIKYMDMVNPDGTVLMSCIVIDYKEKPHVAVFSVSRVTDKKTQKMLKDLYQTFGPINAELLGLKKEVLPDLNIDEKPVEPAAPVVEKPATIVNRREDDELNLDEKPVETTTEKPATRVNRTEDDFNPEIGEVTPAAEKPKVNRFEDPVGFEDFDAPATPNKRRVRDTPTNTGGSDDGLWTD